MADVQRHAPPAHPDDRNRGIEGHQVRMRRETRTRAIADDHACLALFCRIMGQVGADDCLADSISDSHTITD
jgi:hypothetical protein